MLNTANFQRNANQNYNEVSPHIISQNGYHKKVYKQQMLEGMEKREPPPITISGNVNWYNHYGEQNGGSLIN